LTAVQMTEIPSAMEISEALYGEPEAIEFWKEIANERFEIPLEKFCDEVFIWTKQSAIVKKLTPGKSASVLNLECYQKYWSLWLFAGGDEKYFTQYTNPNNSIPPESDCTISFQKFGLLLTWFGQFKNGKFLNELFTASQLQLIYDDQQTSTTCSNILWNTLNNKSGIDWKSDLWLIRCSDKNRHFPFVITYIKPQPNVEDPGPNPFVSHLRIMFNPNSRQYVIHNVDTNSSINKPSINELIPFIQRELKLGEGVRNPKFDLINRPPQGVCEGYMVDYSNINFNLFNSIYFKEINISLNNT